MTLSKKENRRYPYIAKGKAVIKKKSSRIGKFIATILRKSGLIRGKK